MKSFALLFGIFRQRGLVNSFKEGKSVWGFILWGTIFSAIGAMLYGFAMGIGLNLESAVKDAIKLGLIAVLSLAISAPIFILAYRLLGRDEPPEQVISVPVTLIFTVTIILAVTAPIVLLLSLLTTFSPEANYTHIVILDLALLIGIYLAGTLIYHAFTEERNRLVAPNVIGFVMLIVILTVLFFFFSPFLKPYPAFSYGTERLTDRLGIGVREKVEQTLAAASAAERLNYRFQTTNANGDLNRDFIVKRAGNDYLVKVNLYAGKDHTILQDRNIWLLDGKAYTDFTSRQVLETSLKAMDSYLEAVLPPAPFKLPQEYTQTRWLAYEDEGSYIATSTSPGNRKIMVNLDYESRKLKSLILEGAKPGVLAQTRILEVTEGDMDRQSLESNLNKAIVVSSLDNSDASMETYVQDETFFAVRYPRNWHSDVWNENKRKIGFTSPLGELSPSMTVSVYDLTKGKGIAKYADDLSKGFKLQPFYRQVKNYVTNIGSSKVGIVEYIYEQPAAGRIDTYRHMEYIFTGRLYRYHLDFSILINGFETYHDLFKKMAGQFRYLR